MKTTFKFTLTFFCATLLLFSGCIKDECEREITYLQANPVWVNPNGFRDIIESEAARELERPGKIYFYNDYIFINEQRAGVHVVDNSNPESLQRVSFIPIEGNVDIAIRGDIMYADNYIDLIALDVSNPTSVRYLGRSEEVFPHQGTDENGFFLSHYEYEEKSETMNCEQTARFVQRGGFWFEDAVFAESFDFNNSGGFLSNQSNGGRTSAVQNGTGGSLARFTIVDDYLYTIDWSQLHVYDLANPAQPERTNSIEVAWNIETIFPYKTNLFIAGSNGLYIFDNSNPQEPTYLSQFQHATACDPVYVKDDYAYVTLRSGNTCDGFANQLDLIDISNINSPRLEKTFQMKNPHGLGIDGNTLFLCEGEHGLKVFDIEKPEKLDSNQLDYLKNIHAFDVIPVPGNRDLLLVIGEDGFYQYDSSNPKKMKLLSSILVSK